MQENRQHAPGTQDQPRPQAPRQARQARSRCHPRVSGSDPETHANAQFSIGSRARQTPCVADAIKPHTRGNSAARDHAECRPRAPLSAAAPPGFAAAQSNHPAHALPDPNTAPATRAAARPSTVSHRPQGDGSKGGRGCCYAGGCDYVGSDVALV